jgi:hypothetical protein
MPRGAFNYESNVLRKFSTDVLCVFKCDWNQNILSKTTIHEEISKK